MPDPIPGPLLDEPAWPAWIERLYPGLKRLESNGLFAANWNFYCAQRRSGRFRHLMARNKTILPMLPAAVLLMGFAGAGLFGSSSLKPPLFLCLAVIIALPMLFASTLATPQRDLQLWGEMQTIPFTGRELLESRVGSMVPGLPYFIAFLPVLVAAITFAAWQLTNPVHPVAQLNHLLLAIAAAIYGTGAVYSGARATIDTITNWAWLQLISKNEVATVFRMSSTGVGGTLGWILLVNLPVFALILSGRFIPGQVLLALLPWVVAMLLLGIIAYLLLRRSPREQLRTRIEEASLFLDHAIPLLIRKNNGDEVAPEEMEALRELLPSRQRKK